MFKRSFTFKSRAGKTVKATKKKYDEQAKEKMQEKVEDQANNPMQGRWLCQSTWFCTVKG